MVFTPQACAHPSLVQVSVPAIVPASLCVRRTTDADDLTPPEADVVASFHVLEHLHHSPRELFQRLVSSLAPDGSFVLAGPNAANLRKRIQFPFGKVGWSSMGEWYDQPVMRSHVREPLARDLSYIAADLGLCDVEVFGRNFLGRGSCVKWRRPLARTADVLIQRRATLCSDLYLVGRKAAR